MKKLELIVKGAAGLHARPASQVVFVARGYDSTIDIEKSERRVNAKSLISILSLGAVQGDQVTLYIDGADEEIAAMGMMTLFEDTLIHG